MSEQLSTLAQRPRHRVRIVDARDIGEETKHAQCNVTSPMNAEPMLLLGFVMLIQRLAARVVARHDSLMLAIVEMQTNALT